MTPLGILGSDQVSNIVVELEGWPINLSGGEEARIHGIHKVRLQYEPFIALICMHLSSA